MSEHGDAEWAQWQRDLAGEAAEMAKMTDAFAGWAAGLDVLERFTEDQVADLVKAFAAGVTYALDAQEQP